MKWEFISQIYSCWSDALKRFPLEFDVVLEIQNKLVFITFCVHNKYTMTVRGINSYTLFVGLSCNVLQWSHSVWTYIHLSCVVGGEVKFMDDYDVVNKFDCFAFTPGSCHWVSVYFLGIPVQRKMRKTILRKRIVQN